YIFLRCNLCHLYLHLFPTRRSSDLICTITQRTRISCERIDAATEWGDKLYSKAINEEAIEWMDPSVVNARISNSGEHCSPNVIRSEEHTSELQSRFDLVCRRLYEKN